MLHTPHQDGEKVLRKGIDFELRQAKQGSAEPSQEQPGKQGETQKKAQTSFQLPTVGGFPLPFVLILGTIVIGLLVLVAKAVGIL